MSDVSTVRVAEPACQADIKTYILVFLQTADVLHLLLNSLAMNKDFCHDTA